MIRFNVSERKPVSMTIGGKAPIRLTVGQAVVVPSGDAGPVYDGSYVVIPKVEAQTLPTKDKRMADDVSIKGIPIYDVSNNAGGTTVYIGSEI